MKALRYLLMVVAMVSVLSVKAQSTAQLPEVQMQSTSMMVGSGSALPQAAVTGVYTTYDNAQAGRHGNLRNGTFNPGEEPGPDEGDNSEPWEDPLGDAALPLALLALAYAGVRVFRKKRVRE